MTAYQITSMMEGVVQRGTATVVREVGKPVAGKTGTTNDEKDAWFVGFTPDLAVGVYIGYDKPRHLGRGATGGHLAAPIVKRFPEGGARRQAGGAVPRAAGIKLDPHRSRKTGMRAGRRRTAGVILEAFKPGTAPPDSYSVIGYSEQQQESQGYDRNPGYVGVSPDQDRAVRRGTGLW